ncbi:efflux RND transporter permease subunit [Flintibacter muris]|uniref:efflux RND transporter permease subunit n=1 Tax=Flintibacter muris TaxID=2941327 RepID=UPI00204039BA|nr:MMPL family transporter [Flintibacter muris]
MSKHTVEASEKQSPMERVAAFIVDKRKAFYLMYIGIAIFCVFSSGWVAVNDDLTSYLPDTTETRQGLTIMDEEFVTFGTSRIMVDNISYSQAEHLAGQAEAVKGVKSVEFDGTEDHYTNGSALFSITYDGTASDQVSLEGLNGVKALLEGYDVYVTGDVGDSASANLDAEMQVVMVIAIVIILLVLLFTSHTYMEIPVLLMTFGMAALMNKGTNFIFGEISFVSNSVAVVLQLALAIDYAIILCHRYTEEREHLEAREAVVIALSKAIPEISGSSMTTLSGLGAMCFMQFGIGKDLGLVLMKAIVLSLLAVFTLMPGLLLSFSGLIDRTHHKNFVPKITAWGQLAVKTRFIMPPLFVVLLIGGFIFANRCPYAYGQTDLTTIRKNDAQIAQTRVNDTFGRVNTLAVLVPQGDYEREGRLLRELERMTETDTVLGLANVDAMDGYVLTDRLTPRQFAEMTDLDIEVTRLLYSAYAVDQENYGQVISGLDSYGVPLIDMFLYVYDMMEEGYVTLDADMTETIEDLHGQLTDAQLQLKGENYSRLVLQLNLPEESEETFAFLDTLHTVVGKYYPEDAFLVGNSTSDLDLSTSFGNDNLLIGILTIVFVVLVLVFTFQSSGLPILLILVIQGSVWINFSFPYLQSEPLFFLSYLVVSSIQMGANIDYAIVIANRYVELKQTMPLKDAVIESLNEAFPTIVTSGTILASAGIAIGVLSTTASIASIGVCLGRGTLISIFLVMGILPQILLLGDIIIEKTAFTLKARLPIQTHTGTMRVNGHVRGYISGVVDADFSGTLHGTINAALAAGALESEEGPPSALTAGKGAEHHG